MLERNIKDRPTVHSAVIYWAPVIYLALQLGVENTEKKKIKYLDFKEVNIFLFDQLREVK